MYKVSDVLVSSSQSTSRLSGKRAVELIRVSTKNQADFSPESQRKLIGKFAESRGLTIVGTVEFVGSGSIRKNIRGLIDRVIELKNEGGLDFEFLVVMDETRLSRSGASHFGAMITELEENGIEFASASSFIEDANLARLMNQFKAQFAMDQARSIGQGAARGMEQSLEQGRSLPAKHIPYGVDKQVVQPNGTPVCLLRKVGGVGVLRLDPDTLEQQHLYEAGGPGFVKDRYDNVTFVPGEESVRQVVIDMYEMYYRQGLKPYTIAKRLNERGVPSPSGKRWYDLSVRNILNSEIYTGFAYWNRWFCCLYYMRNEGIPLEVKANGDPVSGIREVEDWKRLDLPAMVGFLPPDLRELAIKGQAEYWARYKDGYLRKKRKANGRLKYPLSGGLMVEESTGLPFKGINSGSPSRRYYGLGLNPLSTTSKHLRRRVPADFLDEFVLTYLETVLLDSADFRKFLVREIGKQDAERCRVAGDVERLKADEKRLADALAMLWDRQSRGDAEYLMPVIERNEAELKRVQGMLVGQDALPRLTQKQVEWVADRIMQELPADLRSLASQGDPAVQRVVRGFVSSVRVDLQTKNVKVDFAVDRSVVVNAIMGLAESIGCNSNFQAHPWHAIPIWSWDLSTLWGRNSFPWADVMFGFEDHFRTKILGKATKQMAA